MMIIGPRVIEVVHASTKSKKTVSILESRFHEVHTRGDV